jgi:hypothetical protein
MIEVINRREFIKQSIQTATTLRIATIAAATKTVFKISLAQWSLHRALFKKELDNLEFAKVARLNYGISAVEYVNQFFKDKAKDMNYLRDMNRRARFHGVENRLIMIDDEGALGDPDEAKRREAVENHYKWVEAAKFLGCKMIRVNARSSGSYDERRATQDRGNRGKPRRFVVKRSMADRRHEAGQTSDVRDIA